MQRFLRESQIAAFRLRRHHLLNENQADLTTLCQSVCGVQSQVMAAAQVALWARRHDLTRAEVQSALWKDRALVKTSCMRGTLHLLAAPDLPIYISSPKSSRVRETLRIMSRYGVTQKEADDVLDAVVEALAPVPWHGVN